MEKSKLKIDLIWSFISFGIVGLGGIVINLIIGKFWGTAKLGVFNQIFSFYFILGHLGCIGLHYSVLKHASLHCNDRNELRMMYSVAFYISLIAASIFLALGYLITPFILKAFNSIELGKAWEVALPAFFFYSLNKIQMNFLNGLRSIRLMSLLNALRVILYVVFLVVFQKTGEQEVVKILVYSEIIVFIISFGFLFRYLKLSILSLEWLGKHIKFSKYTLVTGFIQNIETRVDVIMLGLFLDDFAVGIYSFASMLVQGAYQIPVVLRNNVNPIITRLYFNNELKELEVLIKRWIKKLYPFAVALGGIAIVIYDPFVTYFAKNLDFLLGHQSFAILILGIVLVSGYIPFNMIFVQVGKLREHFLYYTILLIVNVLLNALLIPVWKLQGAAIATSVTYALSLILLKLRVRQVLNMKI